MKVIHNLPFAMRRVVALLVLTAFSAPAVTTDRTNNQQPIDRLPSPVAEPQNPEAYAPPTKDQGLGPSKADFGPAQKPFTLATQTDDLMSQPQPAPGRVDLGEKISLDRKIRVPLVHDVQDDATYRGGENDSLLYEIKYLNWGAITGEQLKARQGHYFTITFVNGGPKTDFVTCFEYRQVKSRAVVRRLYQRKANVSGAERAYFGVVNQAYLAYGPISAWRFTVLRGDTVVAEARSYLW